MRIAPMGSESGTYVGMVIGYWEQACTLLNYGLLREDLFFETSGEFFGVWEAVKPVVPAFRERFVNKDPGESGTGGKTLRSLVGAPQPWSHRSDAANDAANAISGGICGQSLILTQTTTHSGGTARPVPSLRRSC